MADEPERCAGTTAKGKPCRARPSPSGYCHHHVDQADGAPADFDPASRQLWADTRAYLVERGSWEDHDAQLLERYVAAVAASREARRAAHADPWVKGSTDQVAPHPGFALALKSDERAHQYARALRLPTPLERERHGADDAGATAEPADQFAL